MKKLWLLGIVLSLLGSITILGTVNNLSIAQSVNTSSAHVDTSNKVSTSDQLVKKVRSSWPWYTARASGLVAAGSLILLMISGIGMITGKTFSFFEPITAWATHRALGISFGISVIVHVVVLYFDRFVPFNITNLLVPFTSNYKPISVFGIPLGSFYVATGVISLYIVAAVIITSLIWVHKKPWLWKVTHLLSYLAMLLVFVHGLYLGTDLAHGILRWAWIALGVSILIMSFMRLRRANTV